MLTFNTLRTLANTTSYQRGQAYFRQEAVGKVTPAGAATGIGQQAAALFRPDLYPCHSPPAL